jgi:hypothetical protein
VIYEYSCILQTATCFDSHAFIFRLFFTRMLYYLPLCACGDWELSLYMNVLVVCRISCKELQELVAAAKRFSLSVVHDGFHLSGFILGTFTQISS